MGTHHKKIFTMLLYKRSSLFLVLSKFQISATPCFRVNFWYIKILIKPVRAPVSAPSTKPRSFHRQIVITKRNSSCAEAAFGKLGAGLVGAGAGAAYSKWNSASSDDGCSIKFEVFRLGHLWLFRFTFINSEEFPGLLSGHLMPQ